MCPDVSVIVVTHNSADTIDACLDSVRDQTSIPHEVIVVDNASSDTTLERLRRRTDVVRLTLEENVGFARGCNRGAEVATGRFLLMLNPDTVVLDDAIGTAATYLANHGDVGAVGATTLYDDGSINPTCCFAQPTLWGLTSRAVGLAAAFPASKWLNPDELGGWDRRSTRTVGAITGCFLMLARALFTELGGFDQRFFMYSEDTDLSWRIQQQGSRCVHLHDAVIVHHGGRSDTVPAQKMVKVFNARAQFMRKHWSGRRARVGTHLLDLTVFLRAVASLALSVVGRGERAAKWREVWRHRAEWRGD